MRRMLLLLLLLMFCDFSYAQQNYLTGTISTSGASCTPSTNCSLIVLNPNQGGISITLSGTFSATVQFEGSADGVNWAPLSATPLAGGVSVTSVTTTGTWVASLAGLAQVRARGSTLASGSVSTTLLVTLAAPAASGSTTVGVAVAANNATIMLGTLAFPCGTQPNCVQMNMDTQMTQGCTFNTTTTIVCPSGTFASTDCVGGTGCTGTGTSKSIAAYYTCTTNAGNYINYFGTTATTIAGFTSSTTVTASHATSGSVGPLANFGCVYWGHQDETGASAVDTLMATYKDNCPAISIPEGIMWLNQRNHFSTQPSGCPVTPLISGASVFGYGIVIRGQGPNTSRIFFDNTTSFTTLPLMTLPQGASWQQFGIEGGGNPGTGGTAGAGSLFADSGAGYQANSELGLH